MRREDEEAIARLGETADSMSAAAAKHQWPELADSDLQFHETLVRSSRSKRLQRMFGTQLVETRICLSTLESAYPVHQRLVREHKDILGAIRRGDEERTLELIDTHLRQTVRDLIDLDS